MTKKSKKDGGLRKDGTSTRTRTSRAKKKGGTPRIMIAAVAVIIAGAALLFWPKGNSVPTGIGERQSVVTVPDPEDSTRTIVPGAPRSGDVDINHEDQKLTPETPEGEKAAAQEEPIKKIEPVVKAKPAPAKPKPKSTQPPPPPILPGSEGRWAVQTGGFGDAANADQEAARLKTTGWDAMVRAGSNSQGEMVYRVWIGYFESRDQANAFIRQNKKSLADAFVVHR